MSGETIGSYNGEINHAPKKNKRIQQKALKSMIKEGNRLREEFQYYLDDLRLFLNLEFWEAVEETNQGKGKRFSTLKEMLKELQS